MARGWVASGWVAKGWVLGVVGERVGGRGGLSRGG